MNLLFFSNILQQYKEAFARINKEEIYKWTAVQHFQQHWDIDKQDFAPMLAEALGKTKNLLASGQYFPARMVNKIADKHPDAVRTLFIELYDEDVDLGQRIVQFKNGLDGLIPEEESLKTYQDHRAVMVYLCLKYPERYFLYKFEMFNGFAEKSGFEYQPRKGALENVFQFQALCQLIRQEVQQDNQLLLMHQGRLGPTEYADTALTILTQDIVYAAVQHLQIHAIPAQQPLLNVIEVIDNLDLLPTVIVPWMQGVHINHLDNDRQAKYIGDIGEKMMMEFESQRLAGDGIHDKVPSHDSLNIGDGLGYDIKSYDQHHRLKFIEVKATRGPFHSPFYITQNELLKSRQCPDQYFLYRLYDINEMLGTAKLIIHQGSLERFCINPTKYTVILANQDIH
jgi:Domain of unknown function (DUF3883)